MNIINSSHMPLSRPPMLEEFHFTDVQDIISSELAKKTGTEGLKERISLQVAERIGLDTAKLPVRVRTWIHQLCLPHTAGTTQKVFTGKLAEPIDLASLSARRR